MTDGEPATWHYGLVARWWAELNVEAPGLDLFLPIIEHGQPALDLACGTGRLLAPLVAAGSTSTAATTQIRAGLWRGGELVAEDEHTLEITLYFTHELELMLRLAGFQEIELRAGYEDRPPTVDDDFAVFLARA